MKKLLAILCVVAVLFCSLFTGVVVSAEDADAGLTQLSPSTDMMANRLWSGSTITAAYRTPLSNATYSAMVQTINSANEYISFGGASGAYFRLFFGNGPIEFKTNGLTLAEGSSLPANYTEGAGFKNRLFKVEITAKDVDLDLDSTADDVNVVVKVDDVEIGNINFEGAQAIFQGTMQEGAYRASREFCGVVVYDVDYALRADEIVDPEMLLTQKTLSDYGIEAGEYYHVDTRDHTAKKGTITSSIDTVLSIDAMLAANGIIKYPSFSNNKGFKLKVKDATTLVLDASDLATELGLDATAAASLATVTAADLGVSVLSGATLKYQVAVEACNTDSEELLNENNEVIFEVKNDVKFTFYLNGYKFYTKTVAGTMTDYTEVTDEEGNTVALENIVTEGGITLFKNVPAPEGVAGTYTLNSLYVNQGKFADYTAPIPALPISQHDDAVFTTANFQATTDNVTLAGVAKINTIFASKITFNKIGGQYLFMSLGAFNLNNTTGKLEFNDFNKAHTLTDYNAVGVAVDLKLALQAVSMDGGAYPNDLKLQIFVDGVLKHTAYYKDSATAKTSKTVLLTPGGVGSDITIERADLVPNDVKVITPADGGFDEDRTITFPATTDNKHEDDHIAGNDLYINYNKTANKALKLLDSVFTAKITNNLTSGSVELFNNGGAQVKFAINASNKLTINAFGNFVSETIPVEKGTEFTLQAVIQYSDFDEDSNGLLDDIRLGAFVNGTLLGGKYWTLVDRDFRYYPCDESTKANLVSYVNFDFRTQAYIAGGKTTAAGTFTIKNPVDLSNDYKNYETITLDDYGVIPGTYTPDASNNLLPKWKLGDDILSIDGKVLKATFTIPTSTKYIELAFVSNSAGAHGISAYFPANGGVPYMKNTKGAINGSGFKLEDFKYDVAQEWMVTYDFEDNGAIKLGIWIDGKLQNNAYYYAFGYGATSDTKAISLYKAGDAATVTFGDADANFVNCEIAEGGYTFTPGAEGYTYNDVAIDGSYTFETVGEYLVKYTTTSGSYAVTGQKTIVVYKANDLNADNDVNILDFIIAKKNAAGTRELTTALARAAVGKYDVTELCDAYDIADIKAAVLG